MGGELRAERRGRKDKIKRDRRVSLRLSDEEFAVLSTAAAGRGLTVAGFAAEVALAASKSATERTRVGRDLAVREALAEVLAAKVELHRIGVNVNQAALVLNSGGEVPAWLESLSGRCATAVARLEESVAVLAKVARR